MPGFLRNYLLRHQHPANLALHVVGVPVTFILPVVLLLQHAPGWAGTAFLLGYVLQFIGHAIEGNDAGELILVKKLLGMPYVAVVPRTAANTQCQSLRIKQTSGSNFAD